MIALQVSDDEQIEYILKQRAKLLGLKINSGVLSYLLSHFSRKLSDQMKLLYQLERASLSEQRKITIPFVREVCEKQAINL